MKVITVTATEFKAKCLQLMDSKQEVIITKRGKVVARMKPEVPAGYSMKGCDKGRIKVLGDIVHFSMGEWEMDERNL